MTVAPNPFAIAADLLFPEPSPYVSDPVGWATNRLGEFWWSGQREIAGMVVRNRYSAIKASHYVSKSHTVSRGSPAGGSTCTGLCCIGRTRVVAVGRG
jgi:hypothetical protein